MSVPLSTVPENQEGDGETVDDVTAAQAKHEAAEIVARARRQAEAIVAEARSTEAVAPASPLAALGDNAEEIIGQVRKLIKKQRQLQDERQAMQAQITELKAERDELVQRLTDAVERMEELSALTHQAPVEQNEPSAPGAPSQPASPPPPPVRPEPELERESTSLAARLEQAERERRQEEARGESGDDEEGPRPSSPGRPSPDTAQYVIGSDGRSFYSRHSAKLPRLEGDGGRSVLSAVGDMRPDSEPKGRKSRRRKKG